MTQYLAEFDGETLARINRVRSMVATAAPQAVESIAYGLIGWKLNGTPLIYVGGFTHHIGMYATPAEHAEFAAEFAHFKHGKGSVQFPLNKPLPIDLIQRVIEFRVRQVNGEPSA